LTIILNKQVIESDELWLVEFFAPWCGHCQQLKPTWEKVAKALKGIVKVGAVDMDANPSVGQPYDVKGFPTIKFFGSDKSKPLDYNSGRDEDSIVNFVLNEVKKTVNKRLKGKADKTEKPSEKKSDSKKSESKKPGNEKDVVVLTDSDFDSTVYGSKDIWFIEFYAPWCGH